jgi:hypothetical protein
MSTTQNLKVTGLSRTLVTILTPIGTLGFLLVFSLFSNFLADLDLLDHLNLPRMSRNPLFDICTKFDCKKGGAVATKLTWNVALILAFWIHHIFLANPQIKKVLLSILPGFGVYERGLYVIGNFKFNY